MVDYADVLSLTRVLEDNNIHTVISAISMMHMGGHGPREIEFIRAADASKTTKRMISSDCGPPHVKEYSLMPHRTLGPRPALDPWKVNLSKTRIPASFGSPQVPRQRGAGLTSNTQVIYH